MTTLEKINKEFRDIIDPNDDGDGAMRFMLAPILGRYENLVTESRENARKVRALMAERDRLKAKLAALAPPAITEGDEKASAAGKAVGD